MCGVCGVVTFGRGDAAVMIGLDTAAFLLVIPLTGCSCHDPSTAVRVRRGPSVGMTARFNAGAADVGGKTQKAKRDPFDCVPRPRLKAARSKKAGSLRSG
jgi:hypothetical protein